jgi:hypothetical protein
LLFLVLHWNLFFGFYKKFESWLENKEIPTQRLITPIDR